MTLANLHCLHPGCKRLRARRGLCLNCYNRLRFAIRAGQDAWAAAEAEGRCLPPNKAAQRTWGRMAVDRTKKEGR